MKWHPSLVVVIIGIGIGIAGFGVVASPNFVVLVQFGSIENLGLKQSRLELLWRKGIIATAKTFEADDAVRADAVDKGEDTGEDLDF